jgi:hypothetical protein
MYYLLWLLYLIPNFIVVTLCWFSNPIVCLFPSRQSNGRDKLWGIFNLWSTHDAPVDEYFYGKYPGTNNILAEYENSAWIRYKYRVKWLTRNTAYGWTYLLFSIPKGKGFQWKGISKTYFGYHNDINIGWKEHGGIEKLSYACRPLGLRKVKPL